MMIITELSFMANKDDGRKEKCKKQENFFSLSRTLSLLLTLALVL